MIDWKYLRNTYNRLAKIFGDKEHYVESTDEAESKLKAKLPILNREARAIVAMIDCNEKLTDCIIEILKTHEKNIDYFKLRREMFLLRKENVKLELEYYGKMDFTITVMEI